MIHSDLTLTVFSSRGELIFSIFLAGFGFLGTLGMFGDGLLRGFSAFFVASVLINRKYICKHITNQNTSSYQYHTNII